MPPTYQNILFYNVGKNMFLTKGTTWGTHAALTENINEALIYTLYTSSDVNVYQLRSSYGSLFYGFNYGSFVDYAGQKDGSPYWEVIEQSDGSFYISAWDSSTANENHGFCLGWDPDAQDDYNDEYYVYRNNWNYYSSLVTNIGCYTLNPELASTKGYAIKWKWVNYNLYNYKLQLYNALIQAEIDGIDTKKAGEYYNSGSTYEYYYYTGVQILDTRRKLLAAIEYAEAEGIDCDAAWAVYNNSDSELYQLQNAFALIGDYTSYVGSPECTSTYYWKTNFSYANNSGSNYSGNYSNGDASLYQFMEAWIPEQNTLNAGRIYQTIQSLPSGIYRFEADVIACNQSTGADVTGVELFADNGAMFTQAVTTAPGKPEHFICYFMHEGDSVTIGLRTLAATTANWVAMDNVKLYRRGDVSTTATAVTISDATLTMDPKTIYQLTATISGVTDDLSRHVVWSSSNKDVATVDSEGNVTAIAEGTATITARAIGSDKQATTKVAVGAAVILPDYDVTDVFVENPDFSNGTASPWIVEFPGSEVYKRNSGYQKAWYSNGNIYVSQFVEAWIDKSAGTLGAYRIMNLLNGLPEGKYTLEADGIATNQYYNSRATGVYLFATNYEGTDAQVAMETFNEAPEHFVLDFIHEGGDLSIGLRTDENTNANWVALDNVKLTCHTESPATAVTIHGGPFEFAVGEETQLTASVMGTDEFFDHVIWWSGNPDIVDIDSKGNVVAKTIGTATIYAQAICSSVTTSTTVTVVASDPSNLVINEIQVANIDQFLDPSFNYGGWMEIYNPGNKSVSLGNLYVSDDPNDLTKFQLPYDFGAVPAGGFATIWFDHHDVRGGKEYSDEAYKQVDFKLEYEGGAIYLSDTGGQLITSQTYPAAIQRCSYARTADGSGTWQMCATPTPAAANAGSTFADTQLAAPVIDKDACLFTTPFTAHVTIPAGATLRYTTDGSTPTLDNGYTSTDGIFDVDYTRVFRFRLYADGYLPSPVVTRSYIYKDQNYYLPIVSVVTDYDNLKSEDYGAWLRGGNNGVTGNGINYEANTNRGWERPVNFEYLVPDPDGGSFLMALNQECDFEVCGGWTRNLYSPESSFRLKGNKYYLGQNFLPYSFFEQKPYIKSKGIVVRNGGNDGYARIKDAGLHEIVLRSGLYLDCQATQPAHVFINGNYRFMFNIREPNHKHHGYSNYGIDTDEMDQFEINGSVGYQQKVGDMTVFRQWMDLAAQLAADPTNDAIFEQICDIVDIDEYTNYMAAELLIGSSDWLTNCNNTKGYRSSVDGKFHLVLMDIDAGFSWTNMISSLRNYYHSYDSRYPITGSSYLVDIFFDMLEYEPFKKRIIDAFYIIDGSVFEPNFSSQVFDDMVSKVSAAQSMERTLYNLQSSANSMVSNISNNRNNNRYYFANYFGLSNPYNLKLSTNTNGARLQINGQEVPRAQFDGQLYAPATITAQAPAGYRFSGWKQPGQHQITGSGAQVFGATDETWQFFPGMIYYGDIYNGNWKTSTSYGWWATALSPFGYGDIGMVETRDYRTTIAAYDTNNNYGYTSSSNKYPSYYFLKTFNINGSPSDNKLYRITCYVDDGCVVYVNGNEVGRYRINGTPSFYSYSDGYEGATAKEIVFDIPTEYLQSGTNYIAAEVHNTSASSSDIYWTAALTVFDTTDTESEYVSTDATLDISTLDAGVTTLVATFEPMSDSDMMADLAMPVRVNEISAANSIFVNEQFKKNDWVELYNNSDTDINAAGLYVSDDIDDPLKYQIPSGAINTVVPAHGHLIIWADKLEAVTQLHTPFKLENSTGSMLLITSSDEFVANNSVFFGEHPLLKDFADGLVYSMHRGDQSVGRYPDGGNNYYMMNRPTIEKTNSLLSVDEQLGTDKGIMENVSSTAVFDLAQGWNWVSHPLTEPISVNKFKDKANVIQSQTLEAYYSSSTNEMEGLLHQLEAGQLYKIQMSADKKYEIAGSVSSKPQPTMLREGWNWIGYTGTSPQTLTDALAGQDVEVGDIIEGQGGFSEYTENGWEGTLSSLNPGYGYMYKSGSAKAVRMKTKSSVLRLRRVAGHMSKGRFGVDRHAYPNVMGITATLELDGNAIEAEGITVVAYADGECRGYSKAVDGRLYLTLYGNGGEHLTLKAVADDGTEFCIAEGFDFTADVLGSHKAPVVLHLGEGTTTDIAAIPVTAARQGNVPIGFYSLSGAFLGNSSVSLRPGIYVVRMADATSRKLIVK